MSKTTLPSLSKMIFPAYLTFRKGVKIADEGIKIEEEFSAVSIDPDNLKEYKQYFNFDSTLPITYIYIVAQRALLHLMLNKKFTIAVPGMVHLSNEIKLMDQFNPDQEFEIKASINVPVKDGSLFPSAVISFYQNGVEVANNVSHYIVKRKSTQKRSKREENVSNFGVAHYKEEWSIDRSAGKLYAKLSNDKNPIHTSVLFAKMAGFKRPIAHGWYSVNRAVSSAEKQSGREFKELQVAFSKPIFLPSKVQFELNENNDFRVDHLTKEYSYLEGKLS